MAKSCDHLHSDSIGYKVQRKISKDFANYFFKTKAKHKYKINMYRYTKEYKMYMYRYTKEYKMYMYRYTKEYKMHMYRYTKRV